MNVTRAGRTYQVVDHPIHHNGDWDFWHNQFPEDWEEGTRQTIDHFVDGGTYVDLGAWVGPTVLWGAEKASRVLAAEPDPIAFEQLNTNVRANYQNVSFYRGAVADHDGEIDLNQRTGWGDSMSTTVPTDGPSITVPCLTIESLFDWYGITSADLIKIDIEGGESHLLKQAEPFLRSFGVPILLAVHPQWWPFNPLPLLGEWTVRTLDEWQVVCVP